MRDLIVCLALDNGNGVGARTQARMLHATARFYGWEGDFLAIHNKQEDFYGHRGTRHAGDLEKRLDSAWKGRYESQNMKMHLDGLASFEGYDRVMFADVDTLFLANPLEMFDASTADVSFAREPRPITDAPFISHMSRAELDAFPKGTKGVNSGQFVIRNNRANEVWARWRANGTAEHHHHHKALQDQGPFNRMLFIDDHSWEIEEFPEGFVKFPWMSRRLSDHWNAKFTHYCGWSGVPKMRAGLQEFLGLVAQKGDHEDTALKIMEIL